MVMQLRHELTDEEIKYCHHHSKERYRVSREKKLKTEGKNGCTGTPFQLQLEDFIGVCGECVVAKALNQPFEPTINTFKSVPDVAKKYEVRATKQHNYRLIIRPDDQVAKILHRPFILVTGNPFEYMVVRGWRLGEDVLKHPEWKKAPNERPWAWFIPQSALRDMETLPL